MIFGYVRTSTKEQNIARQVKSLIDFGVEEDNLFIDQQTGKNFNRPQYQQLKRVLRNGDTLIVHEIDRLGRNKRATLNELHELRNKGVRIKALNIPTTLIDPPPGQELMLDMINNMLIEVYTTFAQQEIESKEKRQKEGMEQMPICEITGKKKSAKTGNVTGRPKTEITHDFVDVYNQWKNKEIKGVEAFTKLNLTKSTFYRLVKEYENKEE